ncbi:inositol monophosphatase family protein [Staphylococcus auricularis]|uniref:inositol-phosphate phosphatase n=1 Tax=Staphylococcus auricularis TaxID=29379 RepID=A0AAW7MAB8_9STAP|nr:inositol monophosphatase family protein [Staphylococcus auricularis]MDC6326413.1 inositol monophosphatase family protein [Staphylococcus auricularis]MDN4532290.1 inositol monophosphatase family protein [Staphylococcus auricularis]
MTLYQFAKALILEAGKNIRETMDETLHIETKSNPNDLVTNVDKQTEQFLVDRIHQSYPDHEVIGEEGHGHQLSHSQGTTWVIDPIDGTLNFVHQRENFSISIGIFQDDTPYAGFVYDVMNDTLYHAKAGEGAYVGDQSLPQIEDTDLKKSIIGINPNWLTKPKLVDLFHPIVNQSRSARAYGSAALEIVHVVTGRLAAYMTPRLQPWDYAGGLIILNEVGGKGTDFLGEALTIYEPHTVVLANPQLHEDLINHYFKPHQEIIEELHAHHRR